MQTWPLKFFRTEISRSLKLAFLLSGWILEVGIVWRLLQFPRCCDIIKRPQDIRHQKNLCYVCKIKSIKLPVRIVILQRSHNWLCMGKVHCWLWHQSKSCGFKVWCSLSNSILLPLHLTHGTYSILTVSSTTAFLPYALVWQKWSAYVAVITTCLQTFQIFEIKKPLDCSQRLLL